MFLSCLCVLYTAVSCQPLILCCLCVLSRIYLFYTAVWCQSLIVFCLCSFVMSMCIIYSCVLSTFDCMLYEGFCHDYIYSIQLCDVNLWLYFVFVVLLWACVLYTAVCCQPLIVCFMRDVVTIIFILYSCVMSIFDCILSL